MRLYENLAELAEAKFRKGRWRTTIEKSFAEATIEVVLT